MKDGGSSGSIGTRRPRHQIRVRATDGLGRVQPLREPYDMHGYLYGAVVNHPVNVT